MIEVPSVGGQIRTIIVGRVLLVTKLVVAENGSSMAITRDVLVRKIIKQNKLYVGGRRPHGVTLTWLTVIGW